MEGMEKLDRIQLGIRAKQLLNFQDLWDVLEQECISQWRASAYAATDFREKEYARMCAITDLKSVLGGMWDYAQALEKQNSEASLDN